MGILVRVGRTLVIVIAFVVAVVALVIWLTPLVWRMVDWAALGAFGTANLSESQVFSNLVGPLGAIAAILALAINLNGTNKTLGQSIRTEQAGRFQKGIELLEKGKSTPVTGGMMLLAALSRENPTAFLLPVANMLTTVLAGLDPELKQGQFFSLTHEGPFADELTKGDMVAHAIINWFGHIRPLNDERWPAELRNELMGARYPLYMVYVNDARFIDGNLSRTDLERFVFRDVFFTNFNLRNAEWSGVVAGPLTFIDCDLRGARLKLWGADGELLLASGAIAFKGNTQLDDCVVNGLGAAQWLAGGVARAEAIAAFDEQARAPFTYSRF
jgi:hypothetical protein